MLESPDALNSLPLGRWPSSERAMGIGFMMPVSERSTFGGTPRFQDMVQMARIAEDVGYDAVWVPDHFMYRLASENYVLRGFWEAWTTLAALAASTSRITLGVLVTCLGWRNPGIVAKMAENLDEISEGRFVLGLGAGSMKPECDMFGFSFDHRVSRFENAVRIVAPMLRNGAVDYQGEYFQAHEAINTPRGPRGAQGGPPIMIGTKGPRMMRLTAEFADAWNSDWAKNPTEVKPLLAALDTACREIGRDPETLVRTAGSNVAMPGYLGVRPNPITGADDQMAEVIAGFRELGFRHWVAELDPCTPTSLEQFAKVMEILD